MGPLVRHYPYRWIIEKCVRLCYPIYIKRDNLALQRYIARRKKLSDPLVSTGRLSQHRSTQFSSVFTHSTNVRAPSQQHRRTHSTNVRAHNIANNAANRSHYSYNIDLTKRAEPLTDSRSPYHPRKALAYARAAVVGGGFLWYYKRMYHDPRRHTKAHEEMCPFRGSSCAFVDRYRRASSCLSSI